MIRPTLPTIGAPMFDLRHAAAAYWQATRRRSRRELEEHAAARLDHWLRHDVPKVPFYRDLNARNLSDLPVIDKATLMADFAAFNRHGITAEAGWQAFAGPRMIGDLIVGASTGTSGNRGLFVISQAERFRWLGTILGKALPGFWKTRHRVAVLLPLNTPLYDSANHLSRLKLRFFDLAEDWRDALKSFAPTVIIAPPKVLRQMAEEGIPVSPQHVFAGAETLDPLDAGVIAGYFNRPVRQIYMATEGLFAVSCPQGALHLCEDTMHFELPLWDGDLREVIISDFSRQTQIMARYRMNDLVRLGPDCPCGMPQRVLAEVVGRADDCFDLPGGMVTPDILRNAVVDADRRITDFRVRQTGPDRVEVLIPKGCDAHAVGAAVDAVLQRKGISADVMVAHADLAPDMSRKLRRVEKVWRG